MTHKLFTLLTAATVLTLATGCNSILYRPGQTNGEVVQQDPTETWGTGTGPQVESDVDDRRWAPIYFAYDQSTVGETEREKLAQIFNYLSDNHNFDLLIEGHCDERGSEEYNRTLGERRAMAVATYLETLGMSKTRMHTLSFGEERPVKQGTTEESFRINRRAELVVISAKKAASLEK
ncbi:hypothetical protein BVX99_00415 [bacterium F16]|nr:hypothetical protein BVX99_00415 [bacterium F16]